MRALITVCICLMSCLMWSQNPTWLPKGAVLDYAEYGFFMGVEFKAIKVVDAFVENDTEVRILERSWHNQCTLLPEEVVFRLHRRGDEVYYLHTDQTEYLLYDFGAMPGDSIYPIVDIDEEGVPLYTSAFVESIDTVFLRDTSLSIQRINWVDSEWAYYDVIIDIGASGSMFPDYALADPGCESLVSYTSEATGKLCFNEWACQLIRTNFDYSPFRTRQNAYFEDGQGRIYSIQMSGQNPGIEPTVLSPKSSIVNKSEACVAVDQFGWTFGRVELHDSTRFDIFNVEGEPITFYLNREIGDDWICYNQGGKEVKAFVKSLDTATVLFVVDSVMTIGFSYAADPQSVLNTIEFQISKAGGVIQLFSFLHFPDYRVEDVPYEKVLPYESLKPFKFRGMDAGMYYYSFLNTTWREVNNHSADDELHVKRVYMDIYGIGSIEETKFKFIKRESGTGSEYNVWDIESRLSYSMGGGQDTVIYRKDTISIIYDKDYGTTSGFNTHPGVALVLDNDPNKAAYSYGGVFNGHASKSLFPPRWNKVDTCWEVVAETQEDVSASTWISSLGGPYFDRIGFVFPPQTDYRVLKYYKLNNGEEWGDPFDFTVATAQPVGHAEISIYPNPANNTIFIKGDFLSSDATCEIYDLGGRLRLKENAGLSSQIDVSSLGPGIYFYKITDHKTMIAGKLVIAK